MSKFKGAIGVGSGPALPPMHKEPDGMINGQYMCAAVFFDVTLHVTDLTIL